MGLAPLFLRVVAAQQLRGAGKKDDVGLPLSRFSLVLRTSLLRYGEGELPRFRWGLALLSGVKRVVYVCQALF